MVNTTGNTISTPDYIFEYSIGEIAITTIEDPSTIKAWFITQGLLQPMPKITGSLSLCNFINDSVFYYPNPTINMLTVVTRNNWITGYRMYAADGKLIRNSFFVNNQISLADLAAGVYFVQLLPGCNNQKFRVLKVIKQ